MCYIQKHPKYKWAIALGDYFSLTWGLGISILLLDSTTTYNVSVYFKSSPALFICSLLCTCFQILFFQILGLYRVQAIKNNRLSFFLLSKGCSLSIPVFFLVAYALQFRFPLFQFFILTFTISLVLLVSVRKICFLLIQHTNLITDRVIIIGAGAKGQSMLDIFSNGIKVKKTIGFIDDSCSKDEIIKGVPVLGEIFESHLIAERNKIDFFVMAIDNISRDHFFKILKYFNEHNLTIYITSNYLNVIQQNVQSDTFDNYSLVRIGQPIQSGLLRFSKRLFDISISFIGIIFLSPLLIFLSFIIKITSKGPIIYKQTRIGKKGQPFTFYKFRSMRVNSDKDNTRNEKVISFIKGEGNCSSNTKIVNHSQITGIGRVIRKTSLDELPQLFNVLKGDMSLVGPRPCLPVEWNVYEAWQKQRLMFMPGCTGIWQVSGRSKVNFEDTVIMDLYYNCNVSLWLDLKILLNTIPVMIFSRGGE